MEPENPNFEIINREAAIISGLLSNGLENLRKVAHGDAMYYQAFYSLSTGLERLMKLVLRIEQPDLAVRRFNHGLIALAQELGIGFEAGSIEAKILSFLDGFANGERYSIVDFLSRNDGLPLRNEPIVKFFEGIMTDILEAHPPRGVWMPPPMDAYSYVLHIREDLSLITSMEDLVVHGQLIDRAAKYAVMYVGRVIRPFIQRLVSHEGPPANPYFSEHFVYLNQRDKYFLERKTYRSR